MQTDLSTLLILTEFILLRMSANTAESRTQALSPIVEPSVESRTRALPYFRSRDLEELMKEENPENLHEKSQQRTNKESVDFCNPCHQYGNRSEMFCCAECLQAFHPSCISAYPTRTREDIRFKHFICPPCALDKSKRSRQKRKRKKQWNSDSD